MTKHRTIGVSVCALIFAASMAAAQAPDIVRVRGTIESVDGQILSVKERNGATMKVKVADSAPVNAIVKASLADIKPNSYIAVTAMPQPDGSQKAVAILIFPEALRGIAEGFRPWDLTPNSTMTNGTVDNAVESVDGQTLVLKYKSGEQKVIVPPTTEIVTSTRATLSDVKPGEKIFIVAAKKLPDGMLEAPNISVGDYGVWR
ncbi:MAG: hypothetical protein P4L80_19595 [Xanthobacteraceae bacterium]|nr:hypothetical protein [Xanthobacteraceae bacterium]